MDSTLVALADIPGFDAQAGLHNLGGRHESFVRVLKKFIATYERGMPDMLTEQSLTGIRDAAHSLRGACLIVGAVDVAALALDLEMDCRNGLDVARLPEAAARLHQAVVALVGHLSTRLA